MEKEPNEVSPSVMDIVRRLTTQDQLAGILGAQTAEQRDKLWERASRMLFPQFSQNIVGYRRALGEAYDAAIVNPETAQEEADKMKLLFTAVEDPWVQSFLTMLLFTRLSFSLSPQRGNNDSFGIEVVEEAQAMIRELGISGGWQDEELKRVDFDRCMVSVLTGDLKFSRQTSLIKF